jgi:hypothetical protein
MENLLDEIDGRLTRITIRYPELKGYIWKQHKHVKSWLQKGTVERADLKTLLGWMTALMVNMPDTEEDIHPVLGRLRDECRQATS